jgi:hypothetical protein
MDNKRMRTGGELMELLYILGGIILALVVVGVVVVKARSPLTTKPTAATIKEARQRAPAGFDFVAIIRVRGLRIRIIEQEAVAITDF